ncbi:MAG: non-canonical purine NTP pyrophosphatase [Longimicrobiales bacterium]|nr:non-canonical purine NTP pyrophosphatase [Longimicrobiales bacterium]
MRRVVVGTRSEHKLAEIREILREAGLDLDVVGPGDLGIPPAAEEDELEPWESFEENALSKARHFHRLTGLPTLSDDSGLVVDALGGAPGVHSKRYSPAARSGEVTGTTLDQANNEHLLHALRGVPEERRRARYLCVVAWIAPGGREDVVRGEVEGRIAEVPSGSFGFGYDPLFFVPTLGCTFGEARPDQKHARSHRGRAFRAIVPYLQRDLAEARDDVRRD